MLLVVALCASIVGVAAPDVTVLAASVGEPISTEPVVPEPSPTPPAPMPTAQGLDTGFDSSTWTTADTLKALGPNVGQAPKLAAGDVTVDLVAGAVAPSEASPVGVSLSDGSLFALPATALDPASDQPPAAVFLTPPVSDDPTPPVDGSVPVTFTTPGSVPVPADGTLPAAVPADGSVAVIAVPLGSVTVPEGLPVVGGRTVVPASQVRFTTMSSADVIAAGFQAVGFTVADVSAVAGSRPLDQVAVVRITVDYSSFAYLYGGNWVSRIRLVRKPGCAIVDPKPGDCPAATVVPITNDLTNNRFFADVEVDEPWLKPVPTGPGAGVHLMLDSGGPPTQYGITSGLATTTGSYQATPVDPSLRWSAGGNNGSFNWSYNVPIPPTGFGASPSVSFNYSSMGLDGLSGNANQQGGQLGYGWDLSAGGFIERSYKSCSADGWGIQDMCWFSDNASITLAGHTSDLVLQSTPSSTQTTWRLKDDPGWQVIRDTGYAVSAYDNRGEIWYVFSPDGTKYTFGLRTEPNTGVATNSVWWEPVYGNNSGEPCYTGTPATEWCNQAWRWNLDRVQDREGNVMLYTYTAEVNNYARFGGVPANATPYVRGGVLAEIRYGTQVGAEAAYRNSVQFIYQNRCIGNSGSNCVIANQDPLYNPPVWFDSPIDHRCTVSPCDTVKDQAPGYWTELELYAINAAVLKTDGWHNADTVFPTMGLYNPRGFSDTQSWQYFLRVIGRTTDLNGPNQLVVPNVQFTTTADYAFPQRADQIVYYFMRIGQIDDEKGGRLNITYGHTAGPCVDKAGFWDVNTQDCYPLWTSVINPPTYSFGYGRFWRYYVQSVVESDPNGLGRPVTTSYTYVGLPVYAHDDSPFSQPNQTWSEPRGFPEVDTRVGPDENGVSTLTKQFFFRGMGGTITYNDGAATAVTDVYPLRGMVYDTETWLNVATPKMVVQDTSYFTPYQTALSGTIAANRVDLTRSAHRELKADGINFSSTEVQTIFDTFGNPTQVWDRGDVYVTADDRCTVNSYVNPAPPQLTAIYLVDLLYASTTYNSVPSPTACAQTNELAASQTFYDGQLTGMALATARPTTTRTRASSTAAWLAATRTFDTDGRVTQVDGPLAGADISGQSYDAAGFPSTSTDATGHQVTTVIDPTRGLPVTVTDLNNNTGPTRDGPDKTTTFTYDSRGRLTAVSLPGDSTPSVTFVYTTPVDIYNIASGVNVIKRSLRQSATSSIESWTYIDGFGRTRETQTHAPTGTGELVTATEYSGLGLPTKQFSNHPYSAAPGTAMYTQGPAFGSSIIFDETRSLYESLGRVIDISTWSQNTQVSVGGQLLHTATAYTGMDQTTTTPANGVTRIDHVNPLGQLDSSQQSNPGGWTGTKTTTYGYDANRNLILTTDSLGNSTTATYDNLGRQTSAHDPDAGNSSATWNADSTLATTTDAMSTVITHNRDLLGRDTSITSGATTLQSFVYDKTAEAGLLDSASSFYNGAEIKIDTIGYDTRNRPTGYTYTIPAITGITAGTGLNGTYTFNNFTYDTADELTAMTMGGLGNMSVETVTTGYDLLGTPVALGGLSNYVLGTGFDTHGRIIGRQLDAVSGTTAIARLYTWDQTNGRLTGMTATQNAVVLQGEAVTYDALGNLKSNSHDRPGTVDDHTECFSYDGINRLTAAFTNNSVGAGSNCTAASAGGPAAYNGTYAYSEIGNITAGPAGAYTYPASGASSVRPHAASTAGPNTFTYRADGTMNTRVNAGVTTTYGWTPQDLLASVTTSTATSTMVYGPGNERILMKDANGIHLYLGNAEERVYNTAAATVTNRRYYTLGSTTIAVRVRQSTASIATVEYLLGDIRGSDSLSVLQGTNTVQQQWYKPYGQTRGSATITSTLRGYIGQQQDPTTNLDYLNNRYYDPTTGIFLSVDPLVASTGDPYLYANGNPTTLSDPSGLDPGCGNGAPASECWASYYTRSIGSSGGGTGGPMSSEDMLSTSSSWQYTGHRYGRSNPLNGPQPPTVADGLNAYPCGGGIVCAHDGLAGWVTAGAVIGAIGLTSMGGYYVLGSCIGLAAICATILGSGGTTIGNAVVGATSGDPLPAGFINPVGIRAAEAATAQRMLDDVPTLQLADAGVPWADLIDEVSGTTYELIGNPRTAQFWSQQSANFLRQIDLHLAKPANWTVLDLTGFSPAQITEVGQHIAGLDPSSWTHLWIVGV